MSFPTEVAQRLERRLAEEQHDRRLPSVVAGVVRDGRLAWQAAAGSATTADEPSAAPTSDTQYRIGSITKTFVAVAVLRLRDEGRLALTDRLRDHVNDAPSGDATIAQTLAHGAGIRAETPGPWWERTVGPAWEVLAPTLDGDAMVLPPGRGFHYSNVGYGFLGQLVAGIRGRSWSDVVREELLSPLGMVRTSPRPLPPAASGFAVHPWAPVVLPEPEHDAGAMAPAGQLWSTVEDLARWAAFLHRGQADVLAADTLAEMRRPLVVDDRPGAPWTGAHGLGLQVWNDEGRRSFGHGGSMPGFLATVQVDEATGDGVVVMTNTTAGLRGSLAGDLAAIVREDAPAPVGAWSPGHVDPQILAVTGPWHWGPYPVVIRADTHGGFELEPMEGPGRASRFRPESDGTYRGLDGYFRGESLRVVRDDRDRVTHLDLASFVLTRTPYDPPDVIPGGVDRSGWLPLR